MIDRQQQQQAHFLHTSLSWCKSKIPRPKRAGCPPRRVPGGSRYPLNTSANRSSRPFKVNHPAFLTSLVFQPIARTFPQPSAVAGLSTSTCADYRFQRWTSHKRAAPDWCWPVATTAICLGVMTGQRWYVDGNSMSLSRWFLGALKLSGANRVSLNFRAAEEENRLRSSHKASSPRIAPGESALTKPTVIRHLGRGQLSRNGSG